MINPRLIFTDNQLLYLLPSLIGFLVVIVYGAVRGLSARVIVLQVAVVAMVAGEVRLPVGDKMLLLGAGEVVLVFLLFLALRTPTDRLLLVPRPYVIILGALFVVLTASSFIFAKELLRSARGLTMLYQELLIPMAVMLCLEGEEEPVEVVFEMLWVAGVVLLVGGLMLTTDSFGFDPQHWASHREFTAPLGLNNTVAGTAAMLFVVATGLTYLSSPRYLLPMVLFAAVLILANSRNGTGAAIVGPVVVVLVARKSRGGRGLWLGLFAVALIGLVASGVLEEQIGRFLFRPDQAAGRDFWGGRLPVWIKSFMLFLSSPFIGVGVHTVYDDELTGMSGFMSHNLFLQDLMAGGVLGFGLRMAALFYVLRAAYREAKRGDSPLGPALFGGLVTGLLFAQLEPFYYTSQQTFVISFFVGLVFVLQRRREAAEAAEAAGAVDAAGATGPAPEEPAPDAAPAAADAPASDPAV